MLCFWAELAAQPSDAERLLSRACDAYAASAAAAPDQDSPADAELLSHAADALIRRGELAAARGGGAEQAGALFRAALDGYAAAAAASDAACGDDLPGLLHNWGCGLHAAAGAAAAARAPLPGLPPAEELLSAAISKLSASSAMGAGDSAPLNALGDVLQAAAELAASSGAPHETSQALLQRALDEGFLPALRLRRDDADALAGVGECRLALSRAAAAAGDAPSASQHAAASADAYERALRTGDVSHLGSVAERCEVQYNFACACVLSRDPARRAVAVAALEQLAAAGATSEGEIRSDADLAALREP